MTVGTITRTVVLFLALFNQVLVIMGYSPIPIDDQSLVEVISLIATIGTAIVAWWKNNSFTKQAVIADGYMKELKGK